MVADGCLQMNILPYDQKNAVLFCALLGALCIILFPRMEWYWILLTLFFAILALVNFHRRLFETCNFLLAFFGLFLRCITKVGLRADVRQIVAYICYFDDALLMGWKFLSSNQANIMDTYFSSRHVI